MSGGMITTRVSTYYTTTKPATGYVSDQAMAQGCVCSLSGDPHEGTRRCSSYQTARLPRVIHRQAFLFWI